MQALISLIRPFDWCFAAIYALPENCLEMLSSPMPVICGVKCSSEYAKSKIIPEYAPITSKDILYYFVD